MLTDQHGAKCSLEYGEEPNYYDYSCKSYYSCSDFWGNLEHCPSGKQFHFEHKECVDESAVFCKWQLDFYNDYGSSSSVSLSSSGSGTLMSVRCISNSPYIILLLLCECLRLAGKSVQNTGNWHQLLVLTI